MEPKVNKETNRSEIHGNEIVTFLKAARLEVLKVLDVDTIDFHGCSDLYVEEKIDFLISALKDLKKKSRIVF